VAEFDILFNKGISFAGDVLDLAAESGVVQKAGTWHSYGETRLGQGRDRAIQFLEENPDMLKTIAAKVKDAAAIGFAPAKAPSPEAPAES
jgi:recombination protein RecA